MKKVFSNHKTGISGADSGCGTTLLALSLANCSASRLRRKTALIEIESNALCPLAGDNYEYNEGLYHFSINDIDIFSSATLKDIDSIFRNQFDEIIIDFGHPKNVSHEFKDCDKQIITASFLPYRYFNLDNFLENNSAITKNIKANYVVYGKNYLSQEWEKKNHKRIFYMPTIFDPLFIPIKDSNYLVKLLKD